MAVTGTGIILAGVITLWMLVRLEISMDPAEVEWPVFAAAAALLLLCERLPFAWIRFGPIGVVTPMWLFAVIMLLVGSPSLTVGVAVLGTLINSLARRLPIPDILVRVASTALALSAAGLAICYLAPRRLLTTTDQIDGAWAGAIAIAGVLILTINALTSATWLSARRRSRFRSQLRRGLAARITAEGALASLAPIWVAGLAFVPLLVPVLAITTVLVFAATRQALEQMHQARHDQLTALLNRNAFIAAVDEVAESARRNTTSLVMLMDLNGFKDINDRLGHHTGDALLVAFADRLEARRPHNAELARLGGDEFAVLVRHTDDPPRLVAESLHRALTKPLRVDGFPITAGVSIGVTQIEPGQHTKEVMRAADAAMYKAKRTTGTIAVHEVGANGIHQGRINLLSDLSLAIERHELHLNFQPQLRLDDGSVDALEALVRWEHPEFGTVPPSEFIGLAEQTDLIEPITEMVLRTATQGLMAGNLTTRLAVNVAPRSLENSGFVHRIMEILKESDFPPHQLELEMTERAMVRDPERTSYAIQKLRAEGVRIAIDDFGVGYSSYQTLRLFEVDRVKIDLEFVQGILTSERDALIVASLIDLAQSLGLDVVAEGVESAPVWDALGHLGCDIAQGYGIAVPMDYVEVRHWLREWDNRKIEQVVPPLPKRVRFATLDE